MNGYLISALVGLVVAVIGLLVWKLSKRYLNSPKSDLAQILASVVIVSIVGGFGTALVAVCFWAN